MWGRWAAFGGRREPARNGPEPSQAARKRQAGADRRAMLDGELAFLRDYARRLEAGEVAEQERIFGAARLDPGWAPPAMPDSARLARKVAQERYFATGLTREQAFALEANCLIRLNRAEAGRARRHVPLLAEADPEAMSLAMTWTGRSLDSLDGAEGCVEVRDLPGQAEAIVAALEQAGVVHCDLDDSGKNLTVGEDGTLSLIDFDYAVLDRAPWSARMREALRRFDEGGGYAGSARRIVRMVESCTGVRLLLLLLDGGAVALLGGAWLGLAEMGGAGLLLGEAGIEAT
jgi:hypothetical protein